MSSLFDLLKDPLARIWSALTDAGGPSFFPLVKPVAPWTGPPLLSPLATLGVLVGLAVSSGVALAAFGVLVAALLALYFLVTEVLGISIEVRPIPF